jgi:2'-hydroxyisoflavone reductase
MSFFHLPCKEGFLMEILVIGGTVFLGRTFVTAALEHGHAVTLFNRGKSNPELFPGIEKLIGDRGTDLSALEGHRWDAVVDTCGYVPRIVRQSAEMLASVVGHYTFISTVSVYADLSKPNTDENSPVGILEDETTEEVTGETYGPLKALCEQAVMDAMPGRALVVRPGLIVGPHDVSDRFTYWVQRVSEGGEVLAPSPAILPIEFIDVRDLTEWILHMIEAPQTGVYNAVGPGQPVTMEQFLNTCKIVSGSDARFTWVDEAFLLQNEVQPWSEMPMWLPSENPEFSGMFAIHGEKALRAGLIHRPMQETIGDTLAWAKTRPDGYKMRAGISHQRERELIGLWNARNSM